MIMHYLDEAVESCENLLLQLNTTSEPIDSQSPVDSQSWTQACQAVGNILTGMGFVEESYAWHAMALDVKPNSARFYAESGRVYSECEIWDKAVYFCQRMLEYQPDNVGMRCHLAKIYKQTGRYRQESQTLNELLTLQPDKATAEGHHQLGKVMERQGQTQAAQNCYERAIDRDNQYVAAYYALGELLTQTAQWERAITLFEHLIKALESTESESEKSKNPNLSAQAMAHYRLGRVYRQSGQSKMAVKQFQRSLQLDAHLHWAYMGLLSTLMQMQQWDEVIEPCKKLLHKAKEFPWIYTFMGNALAGKRNWQEAASAHQQAFKLRGWAQCEERGYCYGQTWFADNIPVWEKQLALMMQPSAARSPIKVLSLGSQDDAAICWLMDKVISHPEDYLTCLTPQISERLASNVTRLERSEQLFFEIGEIRQQLSERIEEGCFSVILLQSNQKSANYLQALLAQAWTRLKPGGVLLISDYNWRHPNDPTQSSRVGINAFIADAGDHIEVLHRSHQLIVKKAVNRSPRPECNQIDTIPVKESSSNA